MSTSSPNVGIGSSNATARLVIIGLNNDGSTATLRSRDSSDVPKVTILDNGCVGIGTSVPSQLMDVVGTLKATTFSGGNVVNWDTAYSWGNHASAGYVTGTPWTGMGYVTGTPWTGMGYLTANPSLDTVLSVGTTSSRGISIGTINSSATITASAFSGPLTGNVTGNASGTAATVTSAAQSSITSVGTLTSLITSGNVGIGTTAIGQRLIIIGGNVGIGSTNPYQVLDVQGRMDVGIGTTGVGFVTCGTTGTNGKLTIGYCTGSFSSGKCTCNLGT